MSTFARFTDRDYDMQDGIERHTWTKQEYNADYGWMIHVKGTGTEDEEAMVLQGAMGFHLADDTDTEVFLLAGSSDTAMKFALPTIPRDKQREWKEGSGGIQSPVDGTRAVEVNPKRVYADDPNFATRDGVLEVKGNTVYIRGDLVVDGDLSINGTLKVAGQMHTRMPDGPKDTTVPGFEE